VTCSKPGIWQATQYGVMDEAALKSYAALLLNVRGQTEAALALHSQLLRRKPAEASREVLTLAGRCAEEGFPQRAQRLLQLVLDTAVCNASHPEVLPYRVLCTGCRVSWV